MSICTRKHTKTIEKLKKDLFLAPHMFACDDRHSMYWTMAKNTQNFVQTSNPEKKTILLHVHVHVKYESIVIEP